MQKDLPWIKIKPTYADGSLTGSGWAIVFWWSRNKDYPGQEYLDGFAPKHITSSRKKYVSRYHQSFDWLEFESTNMKWD